MAYYLVAVAAGVAVDRHQAPVGHQRCRLGTGYQDCWAPGETWDLGPGTALESETCQTACLAWSAAFLLHRRSGHRQKTRLHWSACAEFVGHLLDILAVGLLAGCEVPQVLEYLAPCFHLGLACCGLDQPKMARRGRLLSVTCWAVSEW